MTGGQHPWRLTGLHSFCGARGVAIGARNVFGRSKQIVRGQRDITLRFIYAKCGRHNNPSVSLRHCDYMICDRDFKLQCALQRSIPPDLSSPHHFLAPNNGASPTHDYPETANVEARLLSTEREGAADA